MESNTAAWDAEELVRDVDARRRNYRRLQSWYRHEVLGQVECGTDARKGRSVGSMLTDAAVDGDPRLNFLAPSRFSGEILEYVVQRVPQVFEENGSLDEHRLYHNMLSSMPLGIYGLPGPARVKRLRCVVTADDLVNRKFHRLRPNELWMTDITEHPTREGKLYCCAIKDLFSNRIVGCAIGERMTAQLAVSALRSAIARRRPDGTVIVHSDRAGQFRARSFRAVLTAAGLQGSMGRVASAADNAAMESFHALLQNNVLNRRRWRTRDELRYEIVTWIEHTYNRRRRQRALGKLTPVEFELAFTPPPCLEDDEAA